MKLFTPSLSERKRILDEIRLKHPKWQTKNTLSVILKIIAAGIMIFFIWFVATHPVDVIDVLIILAVGLIFACIPFISGIAVKKSAKFKCALPYSSYANASLLLYEDRLEYVFWYLGSGDPGAYSSPRQKYADGDKFTYSIPKEDVENLEIKNDICSIKGDSDIKMPDWVYEIFTLEEVFPETVKDHVFSFILAFQEKNVEQTLMEWYRS